MTSSKSWGLAARGSAVVAIVSGRNRRLCFRSERLHILYNLQRKEKTNLVNEAVDSALKKFELVFAFTVIVSTHDKISG